MEANAYLQELAARGQLSHAFLLLGTDRKALEKTAQFAAQILLCAGAEKPCGRCVHCKKMKKGIHPDLSRVEREKDRREIGVEQVRILRRDASVLPNEAARRVFLIPEADTMNLYAQNALLKILEEPPPYAAFLLLGQNPGSFLETIRSRCVELRVSGADSAPAPSEEAAGLAECFIGGDRLGFLQLAFRCEKLDREKFDRLLVDLYAASALRARSLRGEKQLQALALCGLVDELREMRKVYVSPGHCLGWLCTKIGESEPPSDRDQI